MEQLIFTLIGALLTWAFYFIQRAAERRGTVDAIERGKQLLALKRELEGAHVSVEELRRFENRLIGKAENAARAADTYFSKAEEVARQSDAESVSQNDMNRQAVEEFRLEDTRLAALVARVRAQLDSKDLPTFEEAHRAWLAFRDRYAKFIAQSYSSGSIRPLIHAVTLESITTNWINELETQLGDDNRP